MSNVCLDVLLSGFFSDTVPAAAADALDACTGDVKTVGSKLLYFFCSVKTNSWFICRRHFMHADAFTCDVENVHILSTE